MKQNLVSFKNIAFLALCVLLLSACTSFLSASAIEVDANKFSAPAVQTTPTYLSTREPNPYSLTALAARTYGDGNFNVEYTWERKEEFVRYKVNYTSDDLTIHGFVNIPEGKGPFPVVIALHGYIPAYRYETLDYSTRYADSIARKGFIVLHPNLRNFPPSDSVDWKRDYHSGFTIDVMNMLAHVRRLAGTSGIFENADLTRIGVWGHSLGGGTALRVVGLVDEIQAAVLYSAVSQRYTNANTGIEIFDYEGTDAAFSVHHGTEDDTIPIGWSQRLCTQLFEVGKDVECHYYEEAPHTFYRLGEDDALFIRRTVEFFDQYLYME